MGEGLGISSQDIKCIYLLRRMGKGMGRGEGDVEY